MTTSNMWEYGNQSDWNADRLAGYKVEATDGSIGKIDKASSEAGAQSIVVKTGLPLIGEKVLLPAGVIERVDHADEKVYVSRTKDDIKNAPEFDENTYRNPDYRDSLGGYYGGRSI